MKDLRLADILARLAAAQARGEAPLPEELCRDAPEFVDAVRAHLAAGAGLPASDKTVDLSAPTVDHVPAAPSTLSDVQIPGFEIMEELGRGGMGVVYLARQVALNRPVALKMILAGSHASERDRQRFRAEAEAIARIQHPGIVQIFDVGTHQGRLYLVLEYINGASLDQQMGEPWAPERAAAFVEQLCTAVQAAHQCGVVHRDLKPANVLLTADGRPKIADFGLAKQLDGAAGITQSGAVLGTPQYMAPEQAAGLSKQIGPWTDVFALGAILYQLLTGKPPFTGDSALQVLEQVCTAEPLPLRERRADVPRDLETICLQALAKAPLQRYRSAADLGADLRRFREGAPIQGKRPGLTAVAARWLTRPERIRDAGAFLIIHGLVRTLAILPQLGKYIQWWESPDARTAVIWLAGICLVLLWAGWRALQGNVLALWTGLVVALVYLGRRVLIVDSLLDSPEQTLQITLIYGFLFVIQLATCGIALIAQRARADDRQVG